MIFSFVSHKGGVGRTFSLIHAGIRLAQMVRGLGLRVLLVDLDLDAPGFAPYFPELDLTASPGFGALLSLYRSLEPGKQRRIQLQRLLAPRSSVGGGYVLPVPGAPNLGLLPAGSSRATSLRYPGLQQALDEELILAAPGWPSAQGFFGDLRICLERDWPFVLVDARAGMTEQSVASSLRLADVLVPCFRLNQANLDGACGLRDMFLGAERPSAPVIPVASPVPFRSSPQIEAWLSKAQQSFSAPVVAVAGAGLEHDVAMHVASMFPVVHRIFEDQGAAVGEWRFLAGDGTPAEGMDQQLPLLGSIDLLVKRLRALNAVRDPGGAELVERYLQVEEDWPRAFTFWQQRARLRPHDPRTWSDLETFYLGSSDATLRHRARQGLEQLIQEMRVLRDAAQLPGGARSLAEVLLRYARAFGPELPDAGLAAVEEACGLTAEEPAFRPRAHHLAGRAVLDLLERRGHQAGLADAQGRLLTRSLAADHLRESLRCAVAQGQPCGETRVLLARVLRGLQRRGEEVRQLDACLL